ncbi:MAG TPA: hypothetical protein VFK06_09275 [Candidatus Angelobacter sp.]|nr:hypothetical protein [Candidatus Angelobacter sp.]
MSKMLWDLLWRTIQGAPAVTSSNWFAYFLSGFIFILNSAWHLTDISAPWRDRWRQVKESKRTDFIRGAVLLSIFWAVLFIVSFINVLNQDRTSLDGAKREIADLTSKNKDLKRDNDNLKQYEPKPEPEDSLRKKAIHLADDIDDFIIKREAKHPPYGPTDDPATVRNIQQFDKETNNLCVLKFKDRTVGIVQRLRSNGLDTEYLDAPAAAPERCLNKLETRLIRHLAHYLDANGNLVKF